MRRREVLVGAGRGVMGLTLIAVAAGTAGTVAGCGTDTGPDIDPLQEPYDLAVGDAEMARLAATAATPALAPALTQIASERTQHAQALADEMGRSGWTTSTPSPTSTSAAPDSAAPPPPSAADVATVLRTSADNAAGLAAAQSGYRAGLLASIAAACTTSFTVTLPTPKAPR